MHRYNQKLFMAQEFKEKSNREAGEITWQEKVSLQRLLECIDGCRLANVDG